MILEKDKIKEVIKNEGIKTSEDFNDLIKKMSK